MDVYFECQVEANPRIRKLIWIHNVSYNKKLYSSSKSKVCYGHLLMVEFLLKRGFLEYITSSRIVRQPKAVESGATENSGNIWKMMTEVSSGFGFFFSSSSSSIGLAHATVLSDTTFHSVRLSEGSWWRFKCKKDLVSYCQFVLRQSLFKDTKIRDQVSIIKASQNISFSRLLISTTIDCSCRVIVWGNFGISFSL